MCVRPAHFGGPESAWLFAGAWYRWTQGWGQSKCFGLQVACCDQVSFPGGWLQAEEGQCLESGAVPAEVAAGRGVVGVAGAVEHADGGIGD